MPYVLKMFIDYQACYETCQALVNIQTCTRSHSMHTAALLHACKRLQPHPAYC